MSQGTITLPSGDKLITQRETLAGGAIVHREEIVLSGTISNQLIVPVSSQHSTGRLGLPVYIPAQPIDAAVYAMNAALNNSVLIAGHVDDSGTATISEGSVGAARITPKMALHVNLRNESGNEVGITAAPLAVNIPGTVQVAFTPASVQSVSLTNVGFAGTPLRIDPTGTTTQPVSIAGTVSVTFPSTQNVSVQGTLSLPDYARYSEQTTQSTRLSNIDTSIQANTAATLGTPAVKFASPQAITFSGAQPISTVAGTVQVAFTPASVQSVSLVNVGFAGTPLRVDPTGTTTQPVSVSGTISLADYARYSEQTTQSTRLSNIDTSVQASTAAILGTPAVKFASAQPITFSGAQPISTVAGTVQVAFTPASVQSVSLINVGFAGTPLRVDPTGTTTQPVSISGTISLADYARYSEQTTQTSRLSTIDTSVQATTAAVLGTPAVKFASAQPITFSGAQPISTVAGTVQVAFTPASVQSVSLVNVGFAGTPLRVDPTGTTTQPVSISAPIDIANVAGTVQVAFTPASVQSVSVTNSAFAGTPVATLAEQVIQSTRLTTIDTSVISARDELRGTLTVKFPSAQSVNVANTPAVTFSGQQPVHGTVIVNSLPAITFASTQNVAIQGTVSIPDYARYSEQTTQTTHLSSISTTVTSARDELRGTLTVKFPSAQAVTFSGQQPVHGTVAVSSVPTVTTLESSRSFKTARIDIGASGNVAVAGSIFGRRLKVYAVNVNADTRGTASLVWLDGTTPLSGTQTLSNREGYIMTTNPPAFIFAPSPGTSIQAHIPSGNVGGLRGWLSYWDDDSN